MSNAYEGYVGNIIPLMPRGTNSTMFTECCRTAICSDQLCCPRCNEKIIGYDARTNHEREKIRWKNATRHWKRKE